LARGAAGTPLALSLARSLALAFTSSASKSFSPPPRRRRPATRSPWALRWSEVLRQPRGRGVRTSPWAPCTFSPFPSLPLSWQTPVEAVDPQRPQQIRARRWARRGRPPPPTGRRRRGGGDSGRVAARKGLARGGSGRGAGVAPLLFLAACGQRAGDGCGVQQPTLVSRPSHPPGARTWPDSKNQYERAQFDHFGLKNVLNKIKELRLPLLTFSLRGGRRSIPSGWGLNFQSNQMGRPRL
jgi:hypothetical protein